MKNLVQRWLESTLDDSFPQRRTEVESWQEHTPFLSALIGLTKPRVVVELGTHRGDSFFAVCEALRRHNLESGSTAWAVDTWQGDPQAGYYDEEIYQEVLHYRNTHYPQLAHLLRMTFDEAQREFGKGSIDLLHIDGLHTEEAVLHDYQSWKDCLSEQGIILFHDIAVRENDFGVYRVWEKLKAQFPHFAFLHGNGLGLLQVGPTPAPAVADLCQANPEERALLQASFAALGGRVRFEGRAARLWHQADALWERTHQAESLADDLRMSQLETEGWNAQLKSACQSMRKQLEVVETDRKQLQGRLRYLQARLGWVIWAFEKTVQLKDLLKKWLLKRSKPEEN